MSVIDNPGRTRMDHLKSGRAKAAVRGTLWSLLSSLAPAALGLLVFLVTSRVLTPGEFGLVAFAASVGTFGLAIAPAGFRDALIQRRTVEPADLDTVFWLCVGAGAVIFAGLCGLAVPIARWSGHPELTGLIPVLSARILFDMAAAVPNALLVRTMSFKQLALRSTVASAVGAAVCLVLLWMGLGLWALAFSQLASSVAISIAAMIAARWRPGLRFDFGGLRRMGGFGLFSTGNHFLSTANIDQLLIGALLGPAGLGLYSFGRRIFQILTDLISGALNLVSYSLLSSLQGEQEKLRSAYLVATFAASVVAFPVFAGLALVAPDLVPLVFGEHWVAAVPVVQAFAALGLLTAIGILQASLIRSQGQADLWFYYVLSKQLGTILYVFLFSGWGVEALSLSLVILNLGMWAPSVHMVVRLLGVSVWTYLGSFGVPVLATLLMGGSVALVQQAGIAGPLGLGASIGAGALTYGLVIIGLGRGRLSEVVAMVRRRR